MDDVTCRVCLATVTPLGIAEGVFCDSRRCPMVKLCRFDVTNTCAENTFCLSFTGERVEVKAQEAAPPGVVVLGKRRAKSKAAPPSSPGLFDAADTVG